MDRSYDEVDTLLALQCGVGAGILAVGFNNHDRNDRKLTIARLVRWRFGSMSAIPAPWISW
jgi:hypothetical protein